jgi:hypothetical protein
MSRYDLLVCRRCQARWFTIDQEPPRGPIPCEHPTGRAYDHDWWSAYQFFADSNGPGLHPTQTGPPPTSGPLGPRKWDSTTPG